MGPQDEKSLDWFNDEVLSRLKFEQDYNIRDQEVTKTEGGIKVKREHVLLFTTGIEKLHRMFVDHEELPIINLPDEEEPTP